MKKQLWLLACLVLVHWLGTGTSISQAQGIYSGGPIYGGSGYGYGYGGPTGMYYGGLGYVHGFENIYDPRPYSSGYYWPNVHWPSRDYHFTYSSAPNSYRVFVPSYYPPRGASYYITAPSISVTPPAGYYYGPYGR